MSSLIPARVLHGAFLAVAMAFLAPIDVWAASAPSPPPEPAHLWLGDPGVDIRTARSRRHETLAAWLQWERATSLGDYRRTGERDPAWDTDACDCLNAYAQSLVLSPEDGKTFIAAATAAAQRALTKGCTDPLVYYATLRLISVHLTHPASENARSYAEVEANMEKSGYSAFRKCFASLRAASFAIEAGRQANPGGETTPSPPGTDAGASLDRALKHLVEVLHDPSVPRDGLFDIADSLLEFAQDSQLGQARIFVPLEAEFASGSLRDAPETATLRMAEGMFWINYGWQARTSGWGSEVSGEGWHLFEERLRKAQTALERAYELDPTDPRICDLMMTVELGQGEGRERMETWFRRAMDADPDNVRACHKKMYYLEPKWYGSDEEMLEFGRQCLATRLPWLLEDAHITLASNRSDADWQAYWKEPAVWKDIQQLYEAALEADPDSAWIRSRYAKVAFLSEHWKLADTLFNELGDRVDLHALDADQKRYEAMRKTVAERAREE